MFNKSEIETNRGVWKSYKQYKVYQKYVTYDVKIICA